MKEPAIKKLYYSISEVSEMTSLKPYVLRYWESEFSDLRPSKNRAGKRIYRSSDVELIRLIKKLLYEEKYTIEGARQKLKASYKGNEERKSPADDKKGRALEDIKSGLREIMELLEG